MRKKAAKQAFYPGSFDPPTLGHLDIITRAAEIFPQVVVGVLHNPNKVALFSAHERVQMLQEMTEALETVAVVEFKGLLVDYLEGAGINVVIRGIRAYTDFESELQMALLNRSMHPDKDTVFMLPRPEYGIISSSRVVEIARLGGDVSHMVPENVQQQLARRFGTGSTPQE